MRGWKMFQGNKKPGRCIQQIQNRDIEVVGYATCNGCPGGNVEYAPEEMLTNGAEVIHLATGLVVGYPPCPYTEFYKKFIEEKYNLKVVIGTHPIPQKYLVIHQKLQTWKQSSDKDKISHLLENENIRIQYN